MLFSAAAALLFGAAFCVLRVTSSTGSFPLPLSSAQEAELLERTKNGDLEARNKLVEHNLRLVAHIIKKYYSSGEDPDDLISIGTIGLIKGISTFDASKQVRLTTYASRCIENEILMMLRGKRKTNREISLYDPIGTDQEGNEIQLYDIIESNEKEAFYALTRQEEITLLYSILDQVLTQRERKVLEMRYGLYQKEPFTQKEIAQKLGISRSYVSRIEKRAIEKLRPFFV